MHCPTCAQAFAHCYDPQQGSHVDDHCACGQLLQWDYPVWSKNSCGFVLVVFQKPAEPFSTVNRACTPFVCL